MNVQSSAFDTWGSVSIGGILSVPDRGILEVPFHREGKSGTLSDGALRQIIDADLKVSISDSDISDPCDGDVCRTGDSPGGRRTKGYRAKIDRRSASKWQVYRRTQAIEDSISIGDIESAVTESRSLEFIKTVDWWKIDSLQKAIRSWYRVPGS